MTVNSATCTASYTLNGVTTSFAVPFPWLVDGDLKVTRLTASTGVTSVMTLNSDYSLTGAGNSSGGFLTLLAANTASDQIYIERDISFVQNTAYPSNSPFPASSHEKALDRNTMGLQQLGSQLDRALLYSPLTSFFDLDGKSLVNGGTAVNPGDVPNLEQMQAAIVAGGAPQLALPYGSNFVGFQQTGLGASIRTALDKMRERISVKDFGAVGDGVANDTSAFLAAIAALTSNTDGRGGTIYVPHGTYKLNQTLVFTAFDSVTNFWLIGDGMLNTTLDFTGSAASTDGIYFNGGSQCGVRDMMITGCTKRGIVLNDSFGSFVSMADVTRVRVQNCTSDGIYSNNSYLVTVNDILSNNNGGCGVNFVGNHTSVIAHKMYAKNNTSSGIAINGATYISINAQSDGNQRGYALSNIQGGVLHAPGCESNRAEGILIQTSDSSATNIFSQYQNIGGLVIIGATALNNNTSGPLGVNANAVAIATANSRPVNLTLIGCVDTVTAGDVSVALSGNSGAITVTMVDCLFKGATVKSGTVEVRNLGNVGRSCTLQKTTDQTITNGAATTVAWDSIASGQNSLGATMGTNAIVIPAGVSRIRAACGLVWAAASAGARYLAIQKNGANVLGLPQIRVPGYNATQYMTLNSGKPIDVVAGDSISVLAIQDSGAPLVLQGVSNNGWLSVEAVT